MWSLWGHPRRMPEPVATATLLAASGLTPVEPASPNAERISDLFWFITFFAIVVFLVVAVPLVVFILRYRNRGRPRDEEGPQIVGNTNLEIAWTAVPVIILVLIAGFTFYKLPGLSLEADNELEVQVEGRQFYWQYRYPNGAIAINKLVAPADRVVKLLVTAPDYDVIHSYWVPALFGKMDAIPGRTNKVEFKGKVGTYKGQCAEFCGLQHAAMKNEIQVIPSEQFDTWLSEQASAQTAGQSDLGEQEFDGVCATCHGDQGQGLIGPAFSAATVSSAQSVEQIVREGRNEMPPVGKGWSDGQIQALTGYLRQRFSQRSQPGG
jgi:cytochrome c oxidase subunit II